LNEVVAEQAEFAAINVAVWYPDGKLVKMVSYGALTID